MAGKGSSDFSLEERELIEKYIRKGFSLSEISIIINRSKNGVIHEVRRNEGRETYNALKAHQRAEEIKANKYKKISEGMKGKAVRSPYETRLKSLEMQVEILHETIKELLSK